MGPQRRHWIFALLSMASSNMQTSDKAQWNESETSALLDYLVVHQAESGDAGNFKMATYNAAATAIAPLLNKGPKKTGKMCKNKWVMVCHREFVALFTDFDVFSVEVNIKHY